MNQNARSPEEVFEFQLEHFRSEIVDATCFYCVQRTIAFAAAQDRTILRALNQAPLFWNISGNAFQAGLFVALGRIFDQDSAHNIDVVMRAAGEHQEIFRRPAFEARRRRTDPNADNYLVEYMRQFRDPIADDCRALRRRVRDYRRTYETQLRPIRHQYIAHRQVAEAEAVGELFSQVQISALEDLLAFLNALHAALQDLYQNGNRPELRLRNIAIRQWLEMPIDRMPRQDTSEHGVYQTRKCLEQVVNGSPPWVRDQRP